MASSPRLVLMSDTRGWAFWQNMDDLGRTLEDRYPSWEHWVVDEGKVPNLTTLPLAVFRCYHRSDGAWAIDHLLPWAHTLGALRALWFFPEDKRPPGPAEFDLVNRYAGFQVVTEQNFRELEKHCPNVRLLTNPIRMSRFPALTPVHGEVVFEWNGNARHYNRLQEDVKGFHSIILPAVEAAQTRLVFAEYNTKRLKPAEMPDFYATANVALVASIYEGSSNSAHEAMAAGLAMVTTDCGDARENHDMQLRAYGESGIIIVERSIEAFVRVMKRLKADPAAVEHMGRINRQDAIDHWSWDVWRDRYIEFIQLALK